MADEPLTRAELDAYYEHCFEQARLGILDHSLDVDVMDGVSVAEHVRAVLAQQDDA